MANDISAEHIYTAPGIITLPWYLVPGSGVHGTCTGASSYDGTVPHGIHTVLSFVGFL
jgi:hypothetical protein